MGTRRTRAAAPKLRAPSRGTAIVMLLLFAIAAVLSIRGNLPPAALGPDAPAAVFSASRAAEALTRILGDERPHPTGSAANAEVRDRIIAEFGQLGLQASVQRRFTCGGSACATVDNIVVRIPGASPDNAVLLAAHYDSVGAGPGASDDGAGVATLVESARALLAGPPLARDVWLLASDGEELGLIGAEAFVREPEFGRIATVVNMEARGTRGASRLIETHSDNAAIVSAMRRALPRAGGSSVDYEIYRTLPNDTDFTVFRREGREGLNFAWAEGASRYHTPLDDLAHLDRDSLQHHGNNALAMAKELAGQSAVGAMAAPGTPASAAHDTVFFNPFGAALATWPVPWNPILLAIGLALWLALGIRLVRRDLHLGAVVVAGVSVLVTLALLVGLGSGLHALLHVLGAMPAMWTAQGGVLIAVFALLAVPVVMVCGSLVRRWCGIPALALASLLPFAIVATATVVAMPGASYLGLLPLLAGASLGHAIIGRPAVWAGAAALVAAGFWFPYAIDIYPAIGHPGLTAVTLLIGVIALPLLPSLLTLPRAAGLFAGAAIVATLVCAVLALSRPAFDADVPRPANLLYAGNGDTARLYLMPRATMPPGFLREAGFADVSQPVSAWMGWGFPGAHGPALTPPTLQVESDVVRDGRRRISVRLTSKRGATDGGVALPGDIAKSSIRVQGQALAPSRGDAQPPRWRRIALVGLPGEGAVFEFESTIGRPLELHGYDSSPGVPDALVDAVSQRDAVAMPVHGGDSTVAWERLALATTPAL